MRCPRCNCPRITVERTMKITQNKIRRYRSCDYCHKPFSTLEIINPLKKKKKRKKKTTNKRKWFNSDDDYVIDD